MIYTLLEKLPFGTRGKAAVGTGVIMVVCAIPILTKGRREEGHGVFDSERPRAITVQEDEARRRQLDR